MSREIEKTTFAEAGLDTQMQEVWTGLAVLSSANGGVLALVVWMVGRCLAGMQHADEKQRQ